MSLCRKQTIVVLCTEASCINVSCFMLMQHRDSLCATLLCKSGIMNLIWKQIMLVCAQAWCTNISRCRCVCKSLDRFMNRSLVHTYIMILLQMQNCESFMRQASLHEAIMILPALQIMIRPWVKPKCIQLSRFCLQQHNHDRCLLPGAYAHLNDGCPARMHTMVQVCMCVIGHNHDMCTRWGYHKIKIMIVVCTQARCINISWVAVESCEFYALRLGA